MRRLGAVGLGLLLLGCDGGGDIEVYDVPKPAQTDPQPKVPGAPDAGAPFAYTVPSGWVETAPGAMLLKSFDANGAKVSVSRFPGDVGGLLANVNRWRGQLAMPPVDESGLAGLVSPSPLSIPGAERVLLSNDGQRLVVDVAPFEGSTWFFKIIGPEVAVSEQADAFDAFVRTVRVGGER